jgi:hypothetical protein
MILGIAYDEDLANRIRELIRESQLGNPRITIPDVRPAESTAVVDDQRARSGGCPFGAQTPVVSR